MSLIAMAVYDTAENQRTELTRRTLESLLNTVDFTKHRLIISDNGSCEATSDLLMQFSDSHPFITEVNFSIIWNGTNLGTAEAVNKALFYRKPGENAVKMDNDVVIHQAGWVDLMDECIRRDNYIGIIGLKRKDLWQTPNNPDPNYRSELIMLPHEPGHTWLIVEQSADVMGTCTMFNSALLDKIGYMYQPCLYGYDDVLMCHRSHLADFYNCFLTQIPIDHIDPGGTIFCDWKRKHSGNVTQLVIDIVKDYVDKKKSIYYNPFI